MAAFWMGAVRPAVPGSRSSVLLPVLLLAVLSGAISLGYQVMWFRIYADRFGSTSLTFLVVLVAFIGGLGAGALASRKLAGVLSRWSRLSDPLMLVGAIELGIAITALLTLLIDPSGAGFASEFPYRQDTRGIYEPILSLRLWTILSACAMVVPTFLMGTTFPILCHAFVGRQVFPSELYGWNTLGACLGVLATEFLLLRYLGHSRAFLLLVVLNILVALIFVVLARNRPLALRGTDMEGLRHTPARRAQVKRGGVSDTPLLQSSTILMAAILSGFMAGALEVDMFRAVRFSGAITDAAMSFTSFWAITAIFMASWTVRALGEPKFWLVRGAAIGALFVYALTWSSLPELRGWFNQRYMAYVAANVQLDPSVASATIYPLSASLTLLLGFTGAIVFPAYYLISLILPTVCNAAQAQGQHLGRAYGWNTVAFCLGAIAFAWAAPRIDLFFAVKLLFAILAVGALLALSLRKDRPVARPTVGLGLAAVGLAAVLMPRGFDRRFFPPNEAPARYPVRALKSNGTNTTYVVEQPDGDVLYFDSYPMSGASASAQMYMSLMAHMPLLAHPEPKNALLICFGVGNTARAITSHESLRSLDIVDMNSKVFETADEFVRTNGSAHRDPRTRLIHDDGRGYLGHTDKLYDLVTSEPPPPRAAGVYRLYSVEYYRSILDHLTPQGMMTQWLPVNILSKTAADRMIASFTEVFPHVLLFVGTGDQLILLGGRQPFDATLLERRFGESTDARSDLAALGITEPLRLLARVIRTDSELRADMQGVPLISDQRNDLALAVTDPFDRFHLALEPRKVLEALGVERLMCGPVLTEVLNHRKKLLTVVPDYFGAQVTR